MTPPSLDEVLADIRRLPSLPDVVSELIAILENESANIEQLAEGIAKDLSLAARALRVANSPFYAAQNRVASIHDAIVILGFRAVGSLVTAALLTGYFPPTSNTRFDHAAFWRHSIGVALYARILARHAGLDPEAAFTAGLLHDIGVLVLLSARARDFEEVLALRERSDCELAQAERELFGFDHARVGEALALHWRFPPDIVHAVAMHLAPADATRASLGDVTHVANVLANALDLAGRPDTLVSPLDPGAWRRLGLDAQDLKGLFGDIEREHACYCALLRDA
jgi:putative nucleotidyltransferase with HDIG domain